MKNPDHSQGQVDVGKAAQSDRYLRILHVTIGFAAVGVMAVFSFAYLFTTFVQWDDEGYFLQAYHDFLSGHALYDHVFAIYGPFSFWSAALVARFDPANVTHDNFRWALLPIWIMIAALMGGTVWRWTGRFSLSLVTFLLVGSHLKGLAKGVGHPQSWILLALAVMLWLGIDWVVQTEKRWKACLAGLLLGLIFLCKINLGILVLVAIALAVSLTHRGWMALLARAVLLLSAVGFGVFLFLSATIAAEKYFALAYLGSLACTVGVASFRPVGRYFQTAGLSWFAVGLGLSLCLGIGATLAHGTTARALFNALITESALFAKSYRNPFSDAARKGSLLLSLIGVGVNTVIIGWRRAIDAKPIRLGLVKAASGATLLCAFCYDHRLALTGSLLFVCLLVVDVPPLSELAYSNRLLLAVLCLLLSLQLFPMAGEQADWAALFPMTAATVLLADGLDCVNRESGRLPVRAVSLAASTAIMLLAIYLFFSIGTEGLAQYNMWKAEQPVDLPGAHWLRLPPGQTERLRETVVQLHRNCQTVLMIPGLYSFSLWSGVPPAEDKRFNSGLFVWPDEMENNELPNLRGQARGCVLVSDGIYHFFKQFAVTPGHDELLSDVRRTMTPITTIRDLTLYIPSQAPCR